MKTKHTKGNWRIDDSDSPYIDIKCPLSDETICTILADNPAFNKDNMETARLIAKAPEMLKELNHCLGLLCTPNTTDEIRLTCKEQCDTIVRIKNLLAKIRGEE